MHSHFCLSCDKMSKLLPWWIFYFERNVITVVSFRNAICFKLFSKPWIANVKMINVLFNRHIIKMYNFQHKNTSFSLNDSISSAYIDCDSKKRWCHNTQLDHWTNDISINYRRYVPPFELLKCLTKVIEWAIKMMQYQVFVMFAIFSQKLHCIVKGEQNRKLDKWVMQSNCLY